MRAPTRAETIAAAFVAVTTAVTFGCGGSATRAPALDGKPHNTPPATASPAPTISANRPTPTIDAPTFTAPTTVPSAPPTGTTSYPRIR